MAALLLRGVAFVDVFASHLPHLELDAALHYLSEDGGGHDVIRIDEALLCLVLSSLRVLDCVVQFRA